MTSYETGTIVLVRFPFTDLRSDKKRPALVVSPTEYASHMGDIVVLALTSQSLGSDELLLRGWLQAGLPKQTWVRPVIATLSAAIVNKIGDARTVRPSGCRDRHANASRRAFSHEQSLTAHNRCACMRDSDQSR